MISLNHKDITRHHVTWCLIGGGSLISELVWWTYILFRVVKRTHLLSFFWTEIAFMSTCLVSKRKFTPSCQQEPISTLCSEFDYNSNMLCFKWVESATQETSLFVQTGFKHTFLSFLSTNIKQQWFEIQVAWPPKVANIYWTSNFTLKSCGSPGMFLLMLIRAGFFQEASCLEPQIFGVYETCHGGIGTAFFGITPR